MTRIWELRQNKPPSGMARQRPLGSRSSIYTPQSLTFCIKCVIPIEWVVMTLLQSFKQLTRSTCEK